MSNSDANSKEVIVSAHTKHLPSEQNSATQVKIGGKSMDKDAVVHPAVLKKHLSGQEFELASFQRTKIDLKRQSRQDSMQHSDDM